MLEPVCYRVPIVLGKAGRQKTYYIMKGSPDFVEEPNTKCKKTLDTWFLSCDRKEMFTQLSCEGRIHNHHRMSIKQFGYISPEDALAGLLEYLEINK